MGKFGEPWNGNGECLRDCHWREIEVGLPEFDDRIVACVNALEGIDDPGAVLADLRLLLRSSGVTLYAPNGIIQAWSRLRSMLPAEDDE